jgi:hypothetical protein
MQNRIVLLGTFLLSCIVFSQWSIALGACPVAKGIIVPVSAATITFKDGSVRSLKGIGLRYEYVYESDKQFLNPPKQKVNKGELFIGLCSLNTPEKFNNTRKEISKVSLEFEAEYSYTPNKVRLLLTNGEEYVVEGNPSYISPLIPPHDFWANKSEGAAAPEVSVFRLLLLGTDTISKKNVSAVVYDSTEHHDPSIQIMSIEINPKR